MCLYRADYPALQLSPDADVPLKLFSMIEYANISPTESIPRYTVNVLSSPSVIILAMLRSFTAAIPAFSHSLLFFVFLAKHDTLPLVNFRPRPPSCSLPAYGVARR